MPATASRRCSGGTPSFALYPRSSLSSERPDASASAATAARCASSVRLASAQIACRRFSASRAETIGISGARYDAGSKLASGGGAASGSGDSERRSARDLGFTTAGDSACRSRSRRVEIMECSDGAERVDGR